MQQSMATPACAYYIALFFRRVLRAALVLSALSDAYAADAFSSPLAARGSLAVFYGDSITRRGDESGGWIKVMRERFTRDLGRRDIRLINAGKCGLTTGELAAMLRGEFPQRPQAAVVCIGVNDVRFQDRGDPRSLTSYTEALVEIVDRLRQTGAEVIVMPPLLYGEGPRGSNSRDRELDAYSHAAALVAEKRGPRLHGIRAWIFGGVWLRCWS